MAEPCPKCKSLDQRVESIENQYVHNGIAEQEHFDCNNCGTEFHVYTFYKRIKSSKKVRIIKSR